MALWNGSTIDNTWFASTWNHIHQAKRVDLKDRNHALLSAILHEDYERKPHGNFAFNKVTKVSGDKLEVRFMARDADMEYIPTRADNFATANVDYSETDMGNALFEIAKADKHWGIGGDELHRIKGDDAKSLDFVQEKYDLYMGSVKRWLAKEIHKAQGPARNSIAGFQWIVSDGTSTGETAYAQYGFNRGDAANVDLQGKVIDNASAALTLNSLVTWLTLPVEKNAVIDLAICKADIFAKVLTLLLGGAGAQYHYDEKDEVRYGGTLPRIGETRFGLDAYAPANVLELIDTRWWTLYLDPDTFKPKPLVRDPRFRDGYVADQLAYAQNICINPQMNVKVKNVPA